VSTVRSWSSVKHERYKGSADGNAIRVGYERARLAFELGEQIRHLREQRNMTQDELAARSGTSQPAIARTEAGGVEPKLDTLERIGIALGVQLVVRFEAPEQPTPAIAGA
jgi:HTH-type transcriptional regulator/antitoxin HipB